MVKVLVIGSGVYVSGRGTRGLGTVLPALFPLLECGKIKKLFIAVTNKNSALLLQEKIAELNAFLKISLNPEIINLQKENLAEFLKKEQIDLAYVCTPDNTHFSMAKVLLENNVHVQVVKPLAPRSSECTALAELQESKNLLGCVEYHKRFDRSNKQLKNALVEGAIGDPLYFIVEYSQRKVVPLKYFNSWAQECNPFQYLGVHYVDIINWCFDHKVKFERVSAVGNKKYLKSQGLDTYDNVNVTIDCHINDNQFTAHFFINWIDAENTSAMSDQRIKVIGTKGRVECDQKDRGVSLVTDTNSLEHINPDFCRPYFLVNSQGEKVWRYEGYGIDSIANFVDEVAKYKNNKMSYLGWTENRATFRQSIPISFLLEAVHNSLLKNGEWIALYEVKV